MKLSEGSMKLASKALDISEPALAYRIKRSKILSALYCGTTTGETPPAPNEETTIVRTPEQLPPMIELDTRAEEIMKQDREMLRNGLQAAGIMPATIEKIRSLDGLARNAGSLLSASLDYTHRLHIYSTAALFEEMVYIRDTYLRPGTEADPKPALDPMERVFWQRAFNEIADLLGKSNDRTMSSTQAMVAMMKAQNEGRSGGKRTEGKAKPGF
jgi:hypothetical protein